MVVVVDEAELHRVCCPTCLANRMDYAMQPIGDEFHKRDYCWK
jgi:hypothetical protein